SGLTVAPGMVTGRPASRTPIRATFLLSSPAWLAAPQYTSSIDWGSSHGLRATRALITPAARWSGRTPARAPLIFPTGVRPPSPAKTAPIGTSSCRPRPATTRLPGHKEVHLAAPGGVSRHAALAR